jgi:ABC-2 type transport system ATP-binding protein
MLQGGSGGGGGVDPRLTAREAVGLYAAFHDRPRDVDEVLGLVGLEGDAATRTRYRRLSGGERQRLGLGLAIVGRPEVLILDEPSAGLDVEARVGVRELVRHLRDDGAAVLLTSHDLADVERLADRVVIVDHGRVVVAGPLEGILGSTSSGIGVAFASDLDDPRRKELADRIRQVAPNARLAKGDDPRRLRVTDAEPAAVVLATITAWAADADATIVTIGSTGEDLEDRYLEVLRGAEDRS